MFKKSKIEKSKIISIDYIREKLSTLNCVWAIRVCASEVWLHIWTYHLRAILIGVVRQEVNKSAGSSGFMGSNSLAPQAANWMQFLTEDVGELLLE